MKVGEREDGRKIVHQLSDAQSNMVAAFDGWRMPAFVTDYLLDGKVLDSLSDEECRRITRRGRDIFIDCSMMWKKLRDALARRGGEAGEEEGGDFEVSIQNLRDWLDTNRSRYLQDEPDQVSATRRGNPCGGEGDEGIREPMPHHYHTPKWAGYESESD